MPGALTVRPQRFCRDLNVTMVRQETPDAALLRSVINLAGDVDGLLRL